MSQLAPTTVVKHCTFWIVFSFLYLSGLNTALTLSIDGQEDPSIFTTLLHIFIFNVLVGHLITKYEKLMPMIAAIAISGCGIIGFGHFFDGRLSSYSNELTIGLFLSLPFATFTVAQFKQRQTKD